MLRGFMEHTLSVLVFSAHTADFVWRASGPIALYASRGHRVRILCLSYGERGESQGAWKEPGMTLERVKDHTRERLKTGELGLDIDGLRDVLTQRGVVWRD